MTEFNFVDLTILAILFFSVVAGLMRGFVKEVVSLLTWLVAFIVAGMFSGRLASYFMSSPRMQSAFSSAASNTGVDASHPLSYVAIGISFLLIFVCVVILGAVLSFILTRALEAGGISFVNRLLGGVFGLGRGILSVVIIAFLVQLSPLGSQAWWQESEFVKSIQPAVQWLGQWVHPGLESLKSKVGDTLKNVEFPAFSPSR